MDNNNMYGDNVYQNQPTEGTQLNGEPVNYEGNAYQQNGEYPQPNMNYQQDSNNGYSNSYNNNYNNNYNGNYSSNYNDFNNNFQQPYPQQSYQQQLDLEEPVKVSEWIVTWLILMIPCVNLVMMFVWAFSKTEKKSKSNFFKAYLIFMGIIFALYFLIIMVVLAAGISSGAF